MFVEGNIIIKKSFMENINLLIYKVHLSLTKMHYMGKAMKFVSVFVVTIIPTILVFPLMLQK